MKWIGKWKNQYGSVLEITSVTDNMVTGTFRTALSDSGFYGNEIPVCGFCQGDCIGISGGGMTGSGDMLVTYTGLLRGDTLQTIWLVVNDAAKLPQQDEESPRLIKQNWWKAVMVNSDTFERVQNTQAPSGA
ncbi:avidin/streptavidin family protein [Chitinophaga sp. YIM B06452]|uniref:avidin/streptavidin family protein n=1 Tax=Chitinophaga sp. YIM B06452 TaxID=3082158 RepID=UPI0031FEEE73